jgi:MFS family permease
LGIVGSAMGIGASLSTTLAGYMVDHFGRGITFAVLAGIGALGVAAICALLPETRPAIVRAARRSPAAGVVPRSA